MGRLSKALSQLIALLVGVAVVLTAVGAFQREAGWFLAALVCVAVAVAVFLNYWVIHPLLVRAEERIIVPTRERSARNRRRRELLRDDPSGFVLVRATVQGSNEPATDVTGLVLPKVEGGRLMFDVARDVFGGDLRARSLEVEWRQDGGQYRKTFAEGDHIELPEH